jgi:transcriptional regulator with XRE-family HTH domain
MFSDLRKMRLLCGLRQVDVAYCTGVSVSALAAAEHGRRPLNHVEHSLVVCFLNERWQILKRIEEGYQKAVVKGEAVR